MAVVFVRHHGTRAYTGIVNNPIVPLGLEKYVKAENSISNELPSSNSEADYEIWLVNDGKILPILYSSATGKYEQILGNTAVTSTDNGLLKRLVRSSHPENPGREAQPPSGAIRDYIGLPSSLKQLCAISSVIIRGQVVGVLRVAHTPENSLNQEQHTVFVVAVEDYLKNNFVTKPTGQVAPSQTKPYTPPSVIKVWQAGGNLPWKNDTGDTGKGFSVTGNPLLQINSKYILFLTLPEDPSDYNQKRGYVQADYNGVMGKAAELDEYIIADPEHGVVLLSDGLSEMASSFDDGPQLSSIPEKQAIRIIQEDIGHSPPHSPSR